MNARCLVLIFLLPQVFGLWDNHDLYKVLEVSRHATEAEITQAFRRLSRTWHPDKNPSPEATRTYQRISEAYETLTNPETRAAYDERWLHYNLNGRFQAYVTTDVGQLVTDMLKRMELQQLFQRLWSLYSSPFWEVACELTGLLTKPLHWLLTAAFPAASTCSSLDAAASRWLAGSMCRKAGKPGTATLLFGAALGGGLMFAYSWWAAAAAAAYLVWLGLLEGGPVAGLDLMRLLTHPDAGWLAAALQLWVAAVVLLWTVALLLRAVIAIVYAATACVMLSTALLVMLPVALPTLLVARKWMVAHGATFWPVVLALAAGLLLSRYVRVVAGSGLWWLFAPLMLAWGALRLLLGFAVPATWLAAPAQQVVGLLAWRLPWWGLRFARRWLQAVLLCYLAVMVAHRHGWTTLGRLPTSTLVPRMFAVAAAVAVLWLLLDMIVGLVWPKARSRRRASHRNART